jgi:hypothetical protein
VRNNFIKFIIIFLFLFASIKMVFATTYSSTFSFGGKILVDKIAGVTCTGNGFGPLILSSNVGGAVSIITSSLNGNNSTGKKVVGVVSGVYKIIPFYATNQQKKPQKGGWILGRADISIDTSTCKIKSGDTSIPFPVRKTSNYGVSGGSSGSGSSNNGSYTGSTYNYE